MEIKEYKGSQPNINFRKLFEKYSWEYPLVVWWVGSVSKNLTANSQPNIKIVFRKCDLKNNEFQFLGCVEITTSFCDSSHFRVGDIWFNDRIKYQIQFEKKSFKYSLLSQDHVHFKGFEVIKPKLYQANDPLQFEVDNTNFFEFKSGDVTYLIPSVEIFNTLYGSVQLKRILATYDWSEVEKRIYGGMVDYKKFNIDNKPIILSDNLNDTDSVAVAHFKYCIEERAQAKRFYKQAESVEGINAFFPRLAPWMKELEKIVVSGIYIEEAKTFFVLRILSFHLPLYYKCELIKVGNKITKVNSGVDTKSSRKKRKSVIEKVPELEDLTTSSPSTGLGVDRIDNNQKVTSNINDLITKTKDVQNTFSDSVYKSLSGEGEKLEKENKKKSFSEKSGSEKIKQANVEEYTEVISKGHFYDFCSGLIKAKDDYSSTILGLSLYVGKKGFIDLELSGIQKYNFKKIKEEDVGYLKKIETWKKCKSPNSISDRGVLIIKVDVINSDGKKDFILIFEIQPDTKIDDAGSEIYSLRFSGLVLYTFDDKDVEEVDAIIKDVVTAIPIYTGVFKSFSGNIKGCHSDCYQHKMSASNEYLYQNVILNIFRKSNVVLK